MTDCCGANCPLGNLPISWDLVYDDCEITWYDLVARYLEVPVWHFLHNLLSCLGCSLQLTGMLWIHNVDWMLTEKAFRILDGNVHQARSSFFCGPGDVWRYEAIFCLKQGVVAHGRLNGKYVQPSPRNHLCIQSIRKILIDDQRSTGGIDKKRATLHGCETRAIHQTPSLRKQRAMQADHIRLCQKLL